MLNRQQIKLDVRAFIKGKWLITFLAILLVGAVTQFASKSIVMIPYLGVMASTGFMAASPLASSAALALLVPTMYIPMILVVMFASPLLVSLDGYFLKFARGESVHIDDVFTTLKGRYFPYLGAALWRALWTWLWSLLFYIPGIIKHIAYSLTPYIMSENPQLGAQQALKVSMILTKGHKGELFVLWLSFLGWNLLSLITFGLIGAYVQPYYRTTYAVYYEKLKAAAIAEGKVDPADFILAQVQNEGSGLI